LGQISGVIAVGVYAGVGVATGVNVFGQETHVTIADSTLESLSGDINITGKGTTDIVYMKGHSVGGGFVGVAGTVFVTIVNDETKVDIKNSATDEEGKFIGSLTAEKGIVDVASESIFEQGNTVIGGAGIGAVGVGAGINVLVVRNGASLIANSDITAKDIKLNAILSRDVDTKTYAGGAGLVGVAASVSVINMGGRIDLDGDEKTMSALTDSVGKASDMSQKHSGENLGDQIGLNNDVKSGSAVLSIGGTLNATTDSIIANATANNTVKQNVYGAAAGAVAAGAAVGVLSVNDDITASFSGTATVAKEFTLQGQSVNSANTYTLAGAGGLGAIAATFSSVNFTSDINTIIENNSVIRGPSVNVNAIQTFRDFELDTNGTSVGAVGVGGAFSWLNLKGDAVVNIGDGVKIYSPNVSLRAEKKYDNIQVDTRGLAGGLVGGAGILTNLGLSGDANVTVGSAAIRSRDDKNPWAETDKVLIESVVRVIKTENSGQVDAGGLAAAAFGNTNLRMDFNTLIDITGANILTGDITANAWQELRASALHTTQAAGGVGSAGGRSLVQWTGSNKINIVDSDFYSWKNTNILAGRYRNHIAGTGQSVLDAQTIVFNSSVIPVSTSGMTSAVTDSAELDSPVKIKMAFSNSTRTVIS